ncbi:F-box/WD repeat-containing protein-like protein lin-23 [Dothidotthia symphoricarpi CBS 119687]|uniref:F-box/WD repeat-containing protein-like protein lin-23 n=1 Tax=Dothidotthia symphoricarpi CBS 119687 TaxID=1392245 RepID=A0A6A6A3X8_9PLEO|nr:F-box/WD repeat-containing protein-like protein lin-23 [Dothidotthia symphoricarpi CBS 119687]KAF2125885.1 F-box/WD repeat-containing protein-like protein lin-23 [Dothidotthia symphoricarpi CBS 119687]
MHRRPSILSYRPKTSSAADDESAQAPSFDRAMKRTASQTFNTHYPDMRDAGVALDAVNEGAMAFDSASSQHSHSSTISRALGAVTGPFTRQKARRRMSSFSSATTSAPRRRGSVQSYIESATSPSSTHKACSDPQRAPLHHQDSGIPSFAPQSPQSPASKAFSFKRLSTGMSRRRPTVFGAPGVVDRISSSPLPIPSAPGSAARQAAAAANQDRLNQLRREQEHTHRFLNGLIPTSVSRDEEMKDNESGVDMTCASPIVRADSVTEKKKMIDPFQRLPAELATAVLSNLDATSLVAAERVSRSWNEHATSMHVWRDVFLREYEPPVHVTPAPIQMGGLGIGQSSNGKPIPAQDWKGMFEARRTINHRWKTAKPAAIYMNGHTDSVYCCQFDEKKCITGSRDRTIRVWDMQTNKCLRVYGGPNHRPNPNTPPPMEERPEKVLSHPSLNGTRAGNDIYRVPSDYHDASILCLQYDEEIMVTGSSDYTCIVWDITGEDFRPMYRLQGHEAGVLDVCLDNKYIISCSKDAMIKVWDRKTGACIRTLKGHRGPVNAVQLRGNFLVSASGDGLAKLWNLQTGTAIKDFPSEDRGLAAVEFSDDAKYVLAGGNDHVVYKFDAATGSLVHSRVKHEGLVRSLFLDAFNGRIVSGSYDQSIHVSDYTTGATFATYKNWTTSWILSAKSDYRRVVATSQDGRCLILDFGHGVKGAEKLIGN